MGGRAREPVALEAFAPFVATPDCYDGWIYHDGVFELGFNLHWTLRNIAPGEAARAGNGSRDAVIAANDETDALYARLPVVDQPILAGVTDYYREWAAESEPTGRWGGLVPGYEPGDVPVLSIGGWYDVFQRGSLKGYGLGPVGRRRLVMGPWAHGVFGGTFVEHAYGIRADSALVDLTTLQLRWFDRWLKDEDNGAERDSPVSVFVVGANAWRDERDWPPPDVTLVDFFLRSNGHANTLEGEQYEPNQVRRNITIRRSRSLCVRRGPLPIPRQRLRRSAARSVAACAGSPTRAPVTAGQWVR